MAKYRTYSYEISNPEKYHGTASPLIVKSSWELTFAEHCDLLPSVLGWSYETTKIPYRDPLTNNQKVYIPDFFVEVAQRDGYSKHFVFEIKPRHEQLDQYARNSTDAALIARNNAKWAAAIKWADRHSAEFAILNENDLFSFNDNKNPRKNPIHTFAHTVATKPLKAKAVVNAITRNKPKTRKRSLSSTSAKVSRTQRVSRSRKI